jgi:hypothetical protein
MSLRFIVCNAIGQTSQLKKKKKIVIIVKFKFWIFISQTHESYTAGAEKSKFDINLPLLELNTSPHSLLWAALACEWPRHCRIAPTAGRDLCLKFLSLCGSWEVFLHFLVVRDFAPVSNDDPLSQILRQWVRWKLCFCPFILHTFELVYANIQDNMSVVML